MVVDEMKRGRGSRRLTPRTTLSGVAKKVSLLVAGFVGLQAVLFLLLVAGQAVPDEPIIDNLVEAIDAGVYGPSGLPDRMGGISDTFTECVVVGTGLGDGDPSDSAWEQAGYMPRISNCEKGDGDILALAAGESATQAQYYKYWAGYTIITRPVLALVGMEGLRIVAGAMLLASLAVTGMTLAKRLNWWAASALVAPLLLASNVMSTPSTSLSQAISLSFIFLSTTLAVHGAGRSMNRLICFVALGAALFCYVDLLTTPAIPWALAAAVVAAVTLAKSRSVRDAVISGLVAATVWPIAFAITWVSRWVIAAMFLGWDEVTDHVAGNVEFRTGGDFGNVSEEFGASTLTNANYWWDQIPTSQLVVLIVLLSAAVALAVAVRRNGLRGLLAPLVLALPLVVIPIWYEVLKNHSQIHAFFTYRGIPVGFGIGLFALVVVASVRLNRTNVRTESEQESSASVAEERVDYDVHR